MLGCGHICSLDSIICLLACKRKASTINCIMILDQFTVCLLSTFCSSFDRHHKLITAINDKKYCKHGLYNVVEPTVTQ